MSICAIWKKPSSELHVPAYTLITKVLAGCIQDTCILLCLLYIPILLWYSTHTSCKVSREVVVWALCSIVGVHGGYQVLFTRISHLAVHVCRCTLYIYTMSCIYMYCICSVYPLCAYIRCMYGCSTCMYMYKCHMQVVQYCYCDLSRDVECSIIEVLVLLLYSFSLTCSHCYTFTLVLSTMMAAYCCLVLVYMSIQPSV